MATTAVECLESLLKRSRTDATHLKCSTINRLLASGPTPYAGYELVFDTDAKDLSALRVEAMLHDSLPNRGPGRSTTGNFRTDIQLAYAPLDDIANRSTLKLGVGFTDYQLSLSFVEQGRWHILGSGGRPHVAVFSVEEPVHSDRGFRIWVTSEDRPASKVYRPWRASLGTCQVFRSKG